MTEFKVNDPVKAVSSCYTKDGILTGQTGKISAILGGGDYEVLADKPNSSDTRPWFFNEHELQLIEPEKETEVTEFKPGDTVRLIRNGRNWYGENYGLDKDSVHVLVGIADDLIGDNEPPKDFTPWYVNSRGGQWVRSDDIELVSRPYELDVDPFILHIEDINQILEPYPFGTVHFGPDSRIKIEPEFNDYEDPYVRLKIKKSTWDAEELAGLVEYLKGVIDVLEGEVPGESGECLACQIEDLMDSNERLASANEAKRERLAKIRELTEE